MIVMMYCGLLRRNIGRGDSEVIRSEVGASQIWTLRPGEPLTARPHFESYDRRRDLIMVHPDSHDMSRIAEEERSTGRLRGDSL